LKNKGSGWEPYGNWTFTNATEKNRQNEKWIRIKNKIYGVFLTDYGKIAIANETVEGKSDQQLWKKGHPNNEGYYTLQNSELLKLITADTASFELKGKCMINTYFTLWILEIIPLIDRRSNFFWGNCWLFTVTNFAIMSYDHLLARNGLKLRL
jgi:hypothetical protein